MAYNVRRRAEIAIGVGLVIAAATILLTPPKPAPSATTWRPRRSTVAGAFHVHSDRSSDGAGTIDEAAAAAGRAGLQFVVATEHGDGTRAPLPPAYRAGVLWIDGVEISTTDGHYATFGMSQAPYPLAGDARDVAEDVRRLGGTGVAAHGDSLKSEARWRDWNAPIDGVEWLNLDSVWRDAGPFRLARAALTYWFRPSATLASLASRPDETLAHFDAIAKDRRVLTLAASDAHGRSLPSYDACFGAFSTRVELDRGLTGDALADADAVLAALQSGHHFTSIDAFARPGGFEFSARAGGRTANEGDALPEGAAVTFDIHVAGPENARAVLLRNGVPVQDSQAPTWHHETDGRRAEYRVEVSVPGSPGRPPLPWIVSNPIFVGIPDRVDEASDVHADIVAAMPPFAWRPEHDAASTAAATSTGSQVRLHYALGPGTASNQFVAAVSPAPANLADTEGIGLTVTASRPLRFSVELRANGDARWQRSIYADATPRHIVVRFDDMRPIQPVLDAHPPLARIDALLLLVGVSHTAPGTSADIAFSDVSLLKF
jgi:hypothetical protein